MTHILVALILLVAGNQVSITIIETDREHDGFVGPVKKVFVQRSPISGGDDPVGSRCRQMTKVYNRHGRLMQHSLYPGSCGSDEIRYEYSYTPGGGRIEKSQKIRGGGSPPPPPPVALGSTPDTGRGGPRMWFMFDRLSGKIIESASYRPDGKIINKTRYTYDDKRRMTEMTVRDRAGRVSSRRVYGYSGNERVPSSFAYYDGKGNVFERTTYSDYKFNSQGDWVSRKEATEERLNRRSVSLTVREIEYHNGVGPDWGAGFGTGRGHNTGVGDPNIGDPGLVGGVTDYSRTFKANEVTRKAVLLSKPEPGFTDAARRNNVTGVVKLRLALRADGTVSDISVVRGLPDGLTERAIEAAKGIRFTPAQKDGRPVSQWLTIDYNFNAH